MTTVNLSVEQCHTLAFRALRANGCDKPNARAIAEVVSAAERDLCHSHGLFRLPLYLGALKSGKVNGSARPTYARLSPSVIQVQGDHAVFLRRFGTICLMKQQPMRLHKRLSASLSIS